MKIALLGYAKTNKSVHKYLKGKYPDATFTILDQKRDPNYLNHLEDFDVVYRTPVISYLRPEVQKAIKAGVNVTTATNLFFEEAKGTIIGVTGTKGKGTTTTLVYEILKKAGEDVYIGGNNDLPEPDILPKLKDDSITVLELSSFRLQDVKHSPHIAGVLEIFPEHLDWHKNFREYLHAKYGIAKHQRKDDFIFYFPDKKYSKKIAKESKGQKIGVDPTDLKIDLPIPGEHNRRNVAMAAAICAHLGIKPDIILQTIKEHKGLPYRIELTRDINGVLYYNDSASTNPQTSAAAVKAFPGRSKILIAGGADKNLDYTPLKKALEEESVKLVILYGENRQKIKDSIGQVAPVKESSSSLEKAVEMATKAASSGDIIIFSPGATSFDMFNDYKHRGEVFDSIVKKIKG